MDKRTSRTVIYVACRRSALGVISAFRTVPKDTAVVIEGIMPLKLVMDIESRKHDTRREIDLSNPDQIVDDAKDKWQQDFAIQSIGEWTKRNYRYSRML